MLSNENIVKMNIRARLNNTFSKHLLIECLLKNI